MAYRNAYILHTLININYAKEQTMVIKDWVDGYRKGYPVTTPRDTEQGPLRALCDEDRGK
jgi:hypothetical protein